MSEKVLINLLCYNTLETHGERALYASIDSFLNQKDVEYELIIADNNSSDQTWNKLLEKYDDNHKLKLLRHEANYGYAAGQNFAVQQFLAGDYQYLLCATHDVGFFANCLKELVAAASKNSGVILSPVFFRADNNLQQIYPIKIDAAGMVLEKSLRHFDLDLMPDSDLQPVFGATGAAIFFDRLAVEKLILKGEKHDRDSELIYPQLAQKREHRAALFDEAFFAYREDADLSWRANLLGIKCYCVKAAQALHIRKVTPERRSILDSKINYWSVRNRFLLQINNYFYSRQPESFWSGMIYRNLVVILGILIIERTSLRALKDLWILRKRAFERREKIKKLIRKVS